MKEDIFQAIIDHLFIHLGLLQQTACVIYFKLYKLNYGEK